MIKNNATTLIKKSNNYTTEEFSNDFQMLIDAYNAIPDISIGDVKKEISEWDFNVDKDTLSDFDTVCESYARFVEYQNRIVSIIDSVSSRNEMLEFITKSIKDIGAQFIDGTAKDKDSKTSTMLLPISLEYTQISSALAFVVSTQKAIEFNSQQLARILREREAIAKVNNSNYNSGLSSKYSSETVVKTKNKLG